MHLEGKTDEARSDLARLAIIKKQREDAARKKEEERLGELIDYLPCGMGLLKCSVLTSMDSS